MAGIARSALRLPAADRRRACEALLWLAAARVALWLAGCDRVCRALAAIPPRRRIRCGLAPGECRLAVERAARVLPGASCLHRAMAAAALLARRGQASTLTIAVAVTPSRALDAHAWLESAGTPIIGADPIPRAVLMRTAVGRPA
jgi:hypothetical protein